MDNIDVEKIYLESSQNGKFKNILYEGSPIVINTPCLPMPFGLEESYNNKFIKLALKDINKSLESQELYTFIQQLENKLVDLIPACQEIQSQLRISPKYDPILTVKIPVNRDVVSLDIVDKNGTPFNIYGLSKGDYVSCKLLIDTVWFFRGKYSYKIKAKKIIVDRV